MATLGKYELHEVLGKGGFGTVYRATDQVLGRVVALKVLHPQWAVDPAFIERFQHEARLLATLEHPNIVWISDAGEEGGRYYLVERYLPGGSLADRIQQGPLPVEDALRILNQVCAGLQELHKQGWVHRDLKPSNILFDASGQAVITDFGLARAMTGSGGSSSSSGTAGTPFYRAPELWRGKPPASPATDVYSLSCILGEMLTGRPLFGGETPDEIITRHLVDGPDFGSPWPPEGVPGWLAQVVEKALQRDPVQRYPDAQSFAQVLTGLNQLAGGEKAAGEKTHKQAEENARIESQSRGGREAKEQTYQQAESVVPPPAARRALPLWVWALLILPLLFGLIYFVARGLTPSAAPTAQPTLPVVALVTEIPMVIPNSTPTSTQEPTSLPTYTPVPTTTPTPTPRTPPTCTERGQIWTSPVDDMILVCVPAGVFEMGNNTGEFREKPQHKVYLDAYWMDQTEVTNAQYSQCVIAGVCTDPSQKFSANRENYHDNGDYDNYPVIYVDWNQASAYCEWAGRKLPTEAQWEMAARGAEGNFYPWGNSFDDTKLNVGNYDGDTVAVSNYPMGASPYGALNMLGNVSEWVRDWYGYYPPEQKTNPTGATRGDFRVFRGGSFDYPSYLVFATARWNANPYTKSNNRGFRCSLSLP